MSSCPTNEILSVSSKELKAWVKKSPKKKPSNLFYILSMKARKEIYFEMEKIIREHEVAALYPCGGRSWICHVKIEDPPSGKSPLFRFFEGKLELAILPHLLEKIPLQKIPPALTGSQAPSSCFELDEFECDYMMKIKRLQESRRQGCPLSKDASSPRYPQVKIKRTWESPMNLKCATRKAAIEESSSLQRRDRLIDKVLFGIGKDNRILQMNKPSKKEALEAGKFRFQRDGLWIIGQEESWQIERKAILDEEDETEGKRKKDSENVECTSSTSAHVQNGSNDQLISTQCNVITPSPKGITSKQHTTQSCTIANKCNKVKDSKRSKRDVPGNCRNTSSSFQISKRWRLNEHQVSLCYEECMNHFEKLMYTVKARALHHDLSEGFDVLRERGRGRYDMELESFDTPKFDFLTNKKSPWVEVVFSILGKDACLIHKGVFLSLPGAEMQVYHQDGLHLDLKNQRPCHAVNVFIPLVDLTAKNGPTEFCLGTHFLGHEAFQKDMCEMALVTAGTPIIFDYRLGHRGLSNRSSEARPIVYLTYSQSGSTFKDKVNFSRKRYKRLGEIIERPLSRTERAKRRKSN